MNIFYELHQDIPREGPGNRESTRKAYEYLNLPANPSILDVGCGPGDQTLELANLSKSSVVAVDIQESFLTVLKHRAVQEGLSEYITPVQASMKSMDFPEHSFDLIWSEGAIYIMGFAHGLAQWRQFLKPRGYMVVSELSWLTDAPSAEATQFWQVNYPNMKSIAENIDLIEEAGYRLLEHFVLPENGWWDHYYLPLEARIEVLRSKYVDDSEATAVLDDCQLEIDLYRRHSGDYGYVFYIMQESKDW